MGLYFQVENEFGSLPLNKLYMRRLLAVFKAYVGSNALLYTTDGAESFYIDGSVDGALPTLTLLAGMYG